jgi:hypothetical protein
VTIHSREIRVIEHTSPLEPRKGEPFGETVRRAYFELLGKCSELLSKEGKDLVLHLSFNQSHAYLRDCYERGLTVQADEEGRILCLGFPIKQDLAKPTEARWVYRIEEVRAL